MQVKEKINCQVKKTMEFIQACRNLGRGEGGGRAGGLKPPQILAKVDLLPNDNDSKKIKGAKKYEPYKIPCKLLVTLLLLT